MASETCKRFDPDRPQLHDRLGTSTFWDRRTQSDQPCRKRDCPGVARVDMAWAPDTGMNWLRCCCCGDYWNPGTARYAPGVGEFFASGWQ